MDRRTLLQTAAWTAPLIASQRAGVAWADHYRRPQEDDNIVVGDPCPPVCLPSAVR